MAGDNKWQILKQAVEYTSAVGGLDATITVGTLLNVIKSIEESQAGENEL